VCCSVLQHVAVDMKDDAEYHARSKLCSRMILMHTCVAVCCSVLQCVAVCYSILQYVEAGFSVLQCVAVCDSVEVRCSMLQNVE